MRRILLLLLITATLLSFSCDNKYGYETPPAFERPLYDSVKEQNLYPIRQNGKYGYIDKKGKLVVPAMYDWATMFSKGMGIVTIGQEGYDDPLALIDSKGKIIWQAHSDMDLDVGSNSNVGLHIITAYRNGEHLRGFINRKGEIVIPLFFNHAWNFTNGFARVSVHNPRIKKGDNIYSGSLEEKRRQRWGFINTKGELVVPFDYTDVRDFHEGLAAVSKGEYTEKNKYEGKWGFIDTTGKLVIEMKYENASGGFHEGLACVRFDGKDGFIDKTGKWIIEPQFEMAESFHEGLAKVSINGEDYNSLYGFIDKTGKWVIPPIYHYALDFEDGMACVKTKEEKYGMINKKGEWVIEPKYDGLIFFSERIGVTELNGMRGFIDLKGNQITPFIYSDAGTFHNGLAYVVLNGNFYHPKTTTEIGYINKRGEYVWKPTY